MLRQKVAATAAAAALLCWGAGGVATASVSPSTAPPTLKALKSLVVAGQKLSVLPSSLTSSLALEQYAYYASHPCVVYEGGSASIPTHCVFGDKTSKNVVVLDGDSFAGMWFPTFNEIAIKHHLKLYLVARLGCPFALVSSVAVCKSWQANAATYINGLNPTTIVFASENLSSLQPTQPFVSQQQYASGISSALGTFTSPHVRKIVLLGMPTAASGSPATIYQPNSCIASHLKSLQSCAIPLATALIASRVQADTTAVKSSGATPVSVTSLFCQTTCPMVVDKNLVYADCFHLNVTYAAILPAALAQVIGVTKL